MMAEKPRTPPTAITVEVDEDWLREWVKYGIHELEDSLANHAAFDAFYEKRGSA